MNWRVDFHGNAKKFLIKNRISSEIVSVPIVKAIKKLRGENTNVEISKLAGAWAGFHKIRMGKIRIIAEFNFDECRVYVEVIDWRGNAYKK